MTGLKRDLRYALRMYRRTPFFAGMATLVLAVAIGVATAVFGLYSHLQLKPVPGVRGADRLVSIGIVRDDGQWLPMTVGQFEQLRELLTRVDALFPVGFPNRADVKVRAAEIEARVVGYGRGTFAALGVPMLLGVGLDAASADPVARNVVISERFWREHFDAGPGAIGATVTLGEHEYTVVGVAGGGFRGLQRDARDDAWIPLEAQLAARRAPPSMSEAQLAVFRRTMPAGNLYARLPVGGSANALQQEFAAAMPRLRAEWLGFHPSDLIGAEVVPGTPISPRAHQAFVRQSQLFVAGAVLVLLVASLNLASFFVARGAGRLPELRTRLAVGASRGALVRQLFVEAAVLVAAAGVSGVLLHYWLKTLLLRVPPFADGWTRLTEVGSDWRVFVFLFGAAAVVAGITGLLPAAGIALRPTLVATSSTALGRRGHRLQPLLALQVLAATLIVLAGALFVNDLRRLEQADVGFRPDGLLVGPVGFDRTARGRTFTIDRDQGAAMFSALDARIGARADVESFAFSTAVPFTGWPMSPELVDLVGVSHQPPEDRRRSFPVDVTHNYLGVLGVPLVHGRPFGQHAMREIVVSQAFARQLWGRDDVVGEQIERVASGFSLRGATMMVGPGGAEGAAPPREIFTVVGVVGDVGIEPEAVYYRNLGPAFFGATIVVRGAVAPSVVQPVVDEIIREYMPSRMVESMKPMHEYLYDAFRNERARSRLAGGAALLALVLTMIGLYASMQHAVEARRGELAVRKALGASDDRIVALILRRAGGIVVLGALGAVAVAVAFHDRIAVLLFGLDPTDLSAWGAALAIVIGTGLLAAWLPARRAGEVDPAVALRYE